MADDKVVPQTAVNKSDVAAVPVQGTRIDIELPLHFLSYLSWLQLHEHRPHGDIILDALTEYFERCRPLDEFRRRSDEAKKR